MAHAVFESATGRFIIRSVDQFECLAFSGRGPGRNNPLMEDVAGYGPIPEGEYEIRLEAHPRFKAPAYRLLPEPGNHMFGRSGFWIHGGTESHGCIILPRHVRVGLAKVRSLYVVHRERRAQPVDLISDAQLTPSVQ